jgi:hypothetical protein
MDVWVAPCIEHITNSRNLVTMTTVFELVNSCMQPQRVPLLNRPGCALKEGPTCGK